MKIVAIGGGNIGRGDTNYETAKIDEEIVKLTGKEKPKFLFIGLASNFSDSYYKIIKDIYKNLGCETGKISNKTLTHMEVVENKINEADIIYIGGGDTLKLINILKETGMDKMLDSAIKRNCVIAGMSAGAIVCCKYGLSDYEIMNEISNDYKKIEGLGYINYMFVPHFDTDPKKKEDLVKELYGTNIVALCLDNCTAIKVVDDEISCIKSDINKKITKICYNDGKLVEKNIGD